MSRPITQRRVLWELALGGPRSQRALMFDIGSRFGPGIVTLTTPVAVAALQEAQLVICDGDVVALHPNVGDDERHALREQALTAARAARAKLTAEAERHLLVLRVTERELADALLASPHLLCPEVPLPVSTRRRFDATRALVALERIHHRRGKMDALPGADRVAAGQGGNGT